MPIPSADLLASFDMTVGRKLDISPVLSAILLNDTATLGLVGMGPAVLDTEHKYNSDALNAPYVTLNNGGNVAALDTSFVVDSTANLSVGALLMVSEAGKTEVIEVLTINADGVTVDLVARDVDGGGAVIITDATQLLIISNNKQEGDKNIQNRHNQRSQDSNFSSIFKRTVEVSGSAEAVTQNGMHPGIQSEARHQIMYRSMEMAVEINRAVLYSIKSASAGSDTVIRRTGGIRYWLTQAGGNVLNAAGGAITEAGAVTGVNTLFELAYEKGGNPGILLGNQKQIRKFSAFNTDRFRVAPSDRMVGVFIERYLTTFGQELQLVIDRWFRQDEVMLLDPSKIWLSPLQGRAMFTEPLAKTGDAMSWQVIAELMLVLKNRQEAHGLLRNLLV